MCRGGIDRRVRNIPKTKLLPSPGEGCPGPVSRGTDDDNVVYIPTRRATLDRGGGGHGDVGVSAIRPGIKLRMTLCRNVILSHVGLVKPARASGRLVRFPIITTIG